MNYQITPEIQEKLDKKKAITRAWHLGAKIEFPNFWNNHIKEKVSWEEKFLDDLELTLHLIRQGRYSNIPEEEILGMIEGILLEQKTQESISVRHSNLATNGYK